MSSTARAETSTGLLRAIRNAQRVLLKNDLDPFELVVDLRATPANGGERTYVLMISTASGTASVRKVGIPSSSIEDGSGDAFPGIVQSLVPELLDKMRSSRRNSLAVLPR